jgi:hypothetical protein
LKSLLYVKLLFLFSTAQSLYGFIGILIGLGGMGVELNGIEPSAS